MLLTIAIICFSLYFAYRNITLLTLLREEVGRLVIKTKDLGDLNERIVSLREQIRSTEKTLYMVKDELNRFRSYNDSANSIKGQLEAFGKEIEHLQEKIADNGKKTKT